MQHSLKYGIMFLCSVCFTFFTAMHGVSDTMEGHEKMLLDFTTADDMENWRIVNDGVMGGLSQSKIVLSDKNTAIFQGTVSLENNGGFASTRTISQGFELAGYTGLLMKIKGDGKQYQIRIRTDGRFDGISYRKHVDTDADSWITIRVPFEDFVPVFRGRIVNDAPPISAEDIQQIGFLISDKQAGDFRLEIDWVQVYK